MRAPVNSLPEVTSAASKVCIICKERKSLDCFHKKEHGALGRRTECKPCLNSKVSALRKATGAAAKYYQNRLARNPELRADRVKADAIKRAADPHPFRARALKHYYKNKERAIACGEAPKNKKNPEYSREWYQRSKRENPAAYKARAWVSNRTRRAHLHGADGSYTQEEWAALKDAFGHRCLRCGSTGALTQDHVIPLSKGGSNDIGNIQPLCQPCNSWKGNRHCTDYRASPFSESSHKIIHGI